MILPLSRTPGVKYNIIIISVPWLSREAASQACHYATYYNILFLDRYAKEGVGACHVERSLYHIEYLIQAYM